jgi:phosphonate transport system permease protein
VRRATAFVALAALAWAAWDTGADPARLLRGLPWLLDFVRRMLPPDLRVLPAALAGAITTVEIALLGTAVAAVLALPLGFVSARNVAAPPIFHTARVVLNFFRSVDTLVYALVFVAAVGLGPFPGVLAVIAYTTTSLAKLYSEAIEGIEPGPVDAVTATGATRLQVLRFGVLPQVLPLFLSYMLYRLETNIPADLSPDDRLPRGIDGPAGDGADGDGCRFRVIPASPAARLTRRNVVKSRRPGARSSGPRGAEILPSPAKTVETAATCLARRPWRHGCLVTGPWTQHRSSRSGSPRS